MPSPGLAFWSLSPILEALSTVGRLQSWKCLQRRLVKEFRLLCRQYLAEGIFVRLRRRGASDTLPNHEKQR